MSKVKTQLKRQIRKVCALGNRNLDRDPGYGIKYIERDGILYMAVDLTQPNENLNRSLSQKSFLLGCSRGPYYLEDFGYRDIAVIVNVYRAISVRQRLDEFPDLKEAIVEEFGSVDAGIKEAYKRKKMNAKKTT